MTAFRKDHPFPLLDSTISQVADGRQPLDENLGSELETSTAMLTSGLTEKSTCWLSRAGLREAAVKV